MNPLLEQLDNARVALSKPLASSQLLSSDAKTSTSGPQHRLSEVEVEGDDDEVVAQAILCDVRILGFRKTSLTRPDDLVPATVKKHGDRLDHVLVREESRAY
jgi:hypothetical protein